MTGRSIMGFQPHLIKNTYTTIPKLKTKKDLQLDQKERNTPSHTVKRS
jgi:hypothetical protein